MYTGRFEENLRNGPGTEYHENGNIGFEGQFKDNNFHGQGLLYNLDGLKVYNGMFVDGKKNGRGTEFGETRTEIYVGQFKNGLYHGRGKTFYTHKDINKEEAAYFNDFDGKFQKGIRVSGDILYRNGHIFYSGKLAQEMPDGENVTLYHENGVVQYQGSMKIGVKQGHGKSWYKNGSIKFIGTHDKNDMIQGALYSKLGKLQSRWFSQLPGDTPIYEVEDRHCPHHVSKGSPIKSPRKDNSFEDQDDVVVANPGYKKSQPKVLNLTWFKDFLPNGGLKYEGGKSGAGKYSHVGNLWFENCALQYSGEWAEGLKHGEGLEYFDHGHKVRVIGKWNKGQIQGGRILLYGERGNLVYFGGILNDLRHGYGRLFDLRDSDIIWMQGTWVKDKLHGENCRVNYETTKVTQYLGAMQHGIKQGAGNSYHNSGVSGKDF
jgi:antitoxin component YwqK of YwqJK toxin-antitoxin module